VEAKNPTKGLGLVGLSRQTGQQQQPWLTERPRPLQIKFSERKV